MVPRVSGLVLVDRNRRQLMRNREPTARVWGRPEQL